MSRFFKYVCGLVWWMFVSSIILRYINLCVNVVWFELKNNFLFLIPLLIADIILSLNATDFLERLRGKKLVFVGDSLNRNMWESMVCILSHSITNKARVYEISGRREFKKKGFYAFRFEASFFSILLIL